VEGKHDTVEVWGVRKEYAFNFLLVNQAMPRHSIHTEVVKLTLSNTPEPLAVFVERIDEDHANPRKKWEELGKPDYLSAYEVEMLKASSELVKEPLEWKYEQGNVHLKLSLPPQSVAAITLELGMEEVLSDVSGEKTK
jgi:xylan 1,4-beta-xylosidase